MKNFWISSMLTIFLLIYSSPGIAGSENCDIKLPENLDIATEANSCVWGNEFVVKAISLGLTRVCKVNPNLVHAITSNRMNAKLKIVCDIDGANPRRFPYYDKNTSSIHLWNQASTNAETGATLFHEFLHYAEIPYDPNVHNSDTAALEFDPVYACHVTGFPDVAAQILGDPAKLPKAEMTCSRVKLP